MKVEFNRSGAGIADIWAIACDNASVSIGDDAREGIADAYECLSRHAASGESIYGVSTGLGAAVDTRILPSEGSGQHRIPLARAVGIGRIASRREVRAMMAARLARLCLGYAGASPQIVQALGDLLNRGLYPQVPMTGSLGEADLAPLAHIAAVLTGNGVVLLDDGRQVSGAEAYREVGLDLPVFGFKDGLSLVSSNAASVGIACLAVEDAGRALTAHIAAIALSFEGFRASTNPLDDLATRIRPAPGQHAIAETILELFSGGDLLKKDAARRLQDPISLRCVSPVCGAALSVLVGARAAVDLELRSSDDNPAVLVAEDRVLPNGNFDPTHMALSFDTLGLAFARLSAMAAERIMKLMSPGFSELPRFLAPAAPGSNGFATLQKTISAITAEIAHLAMPMPFYTVPVADRVEDYSSMAMSVVEKTARLVERFRWLTAIELIVAAQAVEMRGEMTLGEGSREILRRVRDCVPPLVRDRSVSADIVALAEVIECDALIPLLPGLGRPAA